MPSSEPSSTAFASSSCSSHQLAILSAVWNPNFAAKMGLQWVSYPRTGTNKSNRYNNVLRFHRDSPDPHRRRALMEASNLACLVGD
jgi:hypothetical protein